MLKIVYKLCVRIYNQTTANYNTVVNIITYLEPGTAGIVCISTAVSTRGVIIINHNFQAGIFLERNAGTICFFLLYIL